MAVKRIDATAQAVKCVECGTVVYGTADLPVPTDYVWRDGRVLCWSCVRKSRAASHGHPTALSNKQESEAKHHEQ